MDKEPDRNGDLVLVEGKDYYLPDPDDNPYAQARQYAVERQQQNKAKSPTRLSKTVREFSGPQHPCNYPDQKEALDRQRYRR